MLNDTSQKNTLTTSDNCSTFTNPKPFSLSTSIVVITNLLNFLHTPLMSYQVMTLLSLNTKTTFKVFSSQIIFSLDIHTLQHQQTQNIAKKPVYHWVRQNAKPDVPTPLIHGSPFLHAFYEIVS